MFNMLSAVFAGSAACGKLDGECARCPACPLHAPPEEGFDAALEEVCAVCREQYSQQMFFCDLAPRHRVHLACGLDMARAQGHGGRLRCPQCRDGSLSRMTPSCAAELLLRSRVLHPLRSFLPPPALDGPPLEAFLRESIGTMDRDLLAMLETRNNLVAGLQHVRGLEPTPPAPAQLPREAVPVRLGRARGAAGTPAEAPAEGAGWLQRWCQPGRDYCREFNIMTAVGSVYFLLWFCHQGRGWVGASSLGMTFFSSFVAGYLLCSEASGLQVRRNVGLAPPVLANLLTALIALVALLLELDR